MGLQFRPVLKIVLGGFTIKGGFRVRYPGEIPDTRELVGLTGTLSAALKVKERIYEIGILSVERGIFSLSSDEILFVRVKF
jgi:hypothetical protein